MTMPQFRTSPKPFGLNPRDARACSKLGLARWRWGEGNARAGLRDFDKAVRLEPTNCRFLHYRGRVRWDLGDFKGARADFNEAIRLCPDDPGDYYAPAFVLKRLGRRVEAISDLEMYLDRDRTHGYRDHHEEEQARALPSRTQKEDITGRAKHLYGTPDLAQSNRAY